LASKVSATNSQNSATTSAANALTSETNAANSATAANASAVAALSSEVASKASENNASGSASVAFGYTNSLAQLNTAAQNAVAGANTAVTVATQAAAQALEASSTVSLQGRVYATYRDATNDLLNLVYGQIFLVLIDETRNRRAAFYQYQKQDNPSVSYDFVNGLYQSGVTQDSYVFLRFSNLTNRLFTYNTFASISLDLLEDGDVVEVIADESLANRRTRYRFQGADYVSASFDFLTNKFASGTGVDRLVFERYDDPQIVPVPATSTSTGRLGEFAVDSGFLYVAVADNSWKRTALTAF
jgi:hypothetical protein